MLREGGCRAEWRRQDAAWKREGEAVASIKVRILFLCLTWKCGSHEKRKCPLLITRFKSDLAKVSNSGGGGGALISFRARSLPVYGLNKIVYFKATLKRRVHFRWVFVDFLREIAL